MTYPEPTLLECDLCGAELLGKDPRPGYYGDGEELKCTDCGAIMHVSCDGESDHYVNGYVCRHGMDDETQCDLCEIQDGSGVGETP